MKKHDVFPWWAGYVLLNPLRMLRLKPYELLGRYVKTGMTILDAGCAMGFFSIPLAEMTGPTGRVFSVDPQKKMLDALAKRAAKRQLSDIIDIRPCTFTSLRTDDLIARIDLALAFGVLHEVRDKNAFIHDIALTLKLDGVLFFGEPHVIGQGEFNQELAMIEKIGFVVVEKMSKGHHRIAVMRKDTWSESHPSCPRVM